MLKNMLKEDLELLSYADLTELILKEKRKPMNTADIFKIICDLLEYTDCEYSDKIGDYYTSLSTDKRFVFLDTNEWDLREKHPVSIVLDDDDDEIEEIEEDVEDEEEDEEDIDNIDAEEDIDDDDDELDDLIVLSDEELEEN